MASLHMPESKVSYSLMSTLEDNALERALQECWTLDETDYKHRKLTLPMFTNRYDIIDKQ